MSESRKLVNSLALKDCVLFCEGMQFVVRDLSFIRVVVASKQCSLSVGQETPVELRVDRYVIPATVVVKVIGHDFIRFAFVRLVPSGRAHLRAFLSPKKVGESLVEDWNIDGRMHFHGLNESELCVDASGEVVFSFLDQSDTRFQFLVRVAEGKGLRAGRLARSDYIAMQDIESDLPLAVSQLDRDTHLKMGECRDIVTNFRPTTQVEYGLKQRLLKAISDHLYSSSHKVDWGSSRANRVAPSSIELV